METLCSVVFSEPCTVDNLTLVVFVLAFVALVGPLLVFMLARSAGTIKLGPLSIENKGKTDAELQVSQLKPANLFWLGHDLHWTKSAIKLKSDRALLLYGLEQSIHHLKDASEGGDLLHGEAELNLALDLLQKNQSTKVVAEQISSQLEAALYKIGGHLAGMQENYQNRPRNAEKLIHADQLLWPRRSWSEK